MCVEQELCTIPNCTKCNDSDASMCQNCAKGYSLDVVHGGC